MSAYDLNWASPLAAWTARMAPVSRRLAVVDVTDRADVDVRLGPLEGVLGHLASFGLARFAMGRRDAGRRSDRGWGATRLVRADGHSRDRDDDGLLPGLQLSALFCEALHERRGRLEPHATPFGSTRGRRIADWRDAELLTRLELVTSSLPRTRSTD